MVASHDGSPAESRPPTLADLLTLCRHLNDAGARYLVIGGMAVIHAGFVRATEDIDLLVAADADNVERVRSALLHLPDRAVREVDHDDLMRYAVIRVADEIVVDLMRSACGIEYAEACQEIEYDTIDGVSVPFPSARLLLRMKQTLREKDAIDRGFLMQRMRSS